MIPLVVSGMHGLGDNLHQRAIMRQLMLRHEVWLESSWVSPYHDLIQKGLHVIRAASGLRTQTKNSERERALFCQDGQPANCERLSVWYKPEEVRAAGSVLGAMCLNTGCSIQQADFRLPVPRAWRARARSFLKTWDGQKPILVYRPLVERTEWDGCQARNPDFVAYANLLKSIRSDFYVVSVADLVPQREWLVGENIRAEMEFHAGEMEFEALAGLCSMASMTFCSPGFAVILSQAVGTPVSCVFGGYENSSSFSAGGRFAPYLGIDPIHPCDNFKHTHWDKRIDMDEAIPRLVKFAHRARRKSPDRRS